MPPWAIFPLLHDRYSSPPRRAYAHPRRLYLLADLILAAFVFAVGLAFYRRASRGVRLDRHPICVACGQDLYGRHWEHDVAPQCPECGVSLVDPKALRVGNRAPARAATVAAVVLLLASGSFAGVRVSQAWRTFEWQKAKPAFLLKHEALSAGDNARLAAVDEINRRFESGELAPAALTDLVPALLSRHADTTRPWRESYGDLLQRLRLARVVSDDQWTAYAANYLTATARLARPGADAADPALLELRLLPRGGYSDPFHVVAEVQLRTAAGKVARRISLTPTLSNPPVVPLSATPAYSVLALPGGKEFAAVVVRLELREREAYRVVRTGEDRPEGTEESPIAKLDVSATPADRARPAAPIAPPGLALADAPVYRPAPAPGELSPRAATPATARPPRLTLSFRSDARLPPDVEFDLTLAMPDTAPEAAQIRLGRLRDTLFANRPATNAPPVVVTFDLPAEIASLPDGARLLVRPVAVVPLDQAPDAQALLPLSLPLSTTRPTRAN